MAAQRFSITLTSPDDTAQRAAQLGRQLQAGDVILLHGDVGAGKTHFARALIQSLLSVPEDVPSPTFTLVQTYRAADVDIWHADLYRLTSNYEVEELGLVDAFSDAICLVEWPDRLGDLAPKSALTLYLEAGPTDDARILTARWQAPSWDGKLAMWQT
tara:strand:- start:24321 stop:24794 length:474 start_codon:yes stop_codon:yes gene_type:complete